MTLAVLLVGPLGLPGIALAIAVAAWLEALLLVAPATGRLPELAVRPIAGLAMAGRARRDAVARRRGRGRGGRLARVGEDPARLVLLVAMIVAGAWLADYAAPGGRVADPGADLYRRASWSTSSRRPRHA